MRLPGTAIPTTAVPVTYQAPSCFAVWWHGTLAPCYPLNPLFRSG